MRLPSLVVVRATMIGVLVSALVPGRFGEPAKAYLVARRAGDTARCFPLILGTVFAQTLINLLAVRSWARSRSPACRSSAVTRAR